VSDRQDQILTAIDAALSGYTESDPVSFDAMRWSPSEPPSEPHEHDYGHEHLQARFDVIYRYAPPSWEHTIPVTFTEVDHVAVAELVDRFRGEGPQDAET
jgi:hypothetical protein